MGDLSPHFSESEFRCKCGTPDHVPHPVQVHTDLVDALERLRRICDNRPLQIRSGHRCAVHNRHVGGARRSRHLIGDAADIPFGYATVEQAKEAGFRGIGSMRGWAVHVDMGPVRRWSYGG